MPTFTPLELAVLHSIFEETPELASRLKAQLSAATVSDRINSGAGFFTTIEVPNDTARVNCPSVLGHETAARIIGLQHGLGFVLFMDDGKLRELEGYAYGESTSSFALLDLVPDVFRGPINQKS